MAQYYPRHVHNTKKQFSHTPISINSFIANKAMDSNSKSFFQGKNKNKTKIAFDFQISYAKTRHLNS